MGKKLKVLYIHEYFTDSQKNGANIIAFNCYTKMVKQGNNVLFYANNQQPYIYEQNINELFPTSHINKKGVINKLIYRLNSIYNIEAQINLNQIIKSFKPDIVHIHSLLELSYSVVQTLNKYKIPYVITAHDSGYICPVMGTKILECTLCKDNPIKCITKKCSKNNIFCSIYMAIKYCVMLNILKTYPPQKIITPSFALSKYLEQSNAYKNRLVCINNSLDDCFLDVEPNYENKGYFLYVGGVIDIKGVGILLNAIKDLPDNIEFHIVGTGVHEDKFKLFVKENKLKNVKFLGKKNRKELIEEYQNCISLITPSNWFENFPTTNMESFINGKPVIGSRIGGIPEMVEHNKTGLLFEPANVEQLKECILKYWKNRDLVVEHGRNAYEKARTHYTEERYYNELMKVYAEVINNAK